MDRAWLRYAQTLTYCDPRSYLVRLRELEIEIAQSDLPERVKHLRTNELKTMRETREAAIFCHGMGQRIGQTVYFSSNESQDYDFIASWSFNGNRHFVPVQLKEVVPVNVNASATFSDVVASLGKYVDSKNLIVAVHLNQQIHFDPSSFVVPQLRIAALWVFASIAPDQSVWGLWGNLIEEQTGTSFDYPVQAVI